MPSASQTTAMNTICVVPNTVSNATSTGIMTGTTIHSVANSTDTASQVTVSVEDLLSPMKMPSKKPKPVINATPQCNLRANQAKSLSGTVAAKNLFGATHSMANVQSDPLAGIKIS